MMRGFGPILWTGGILMAALSCYLVSLQVASERAELERVEREIVMITRDIRELETEIGTRGRLDQLEKWNAGFLDLKAPAAGQFLEGGFQLATLIKPEKRITPDAPMILASAPRDETEVREAHEPRPLEGLLVEASLERPMRAAPSERRKRKPAVDPLAPLPKAVADDGFDFIIPGEDSTTP